MRQGFKFSAPHHGVSHLIVNHSAFQFTINQRGQRFEALVINKPAFHAVEETWVDTEHEAQQWLIRQAKSLIPSLNS